MVPEYRLRPGYGRRSGASCRPRQMDRRLARNAPGNRRRESAKGIGVVSHLYPIMLNLQGQTCLVVGGGRVALRKAAGLLEAGAAVRVVSPRFDPAFEGLGVELVRRAFEPGDLEGVFLVVAATDREETNRLIFEGARERRLLVNVVDVPHLCNFEVPAVARRGALTLAVSTSGSSPALAAVIRKRLEDLFGPEYGELTAHLGALRGKILRKVRDPECRRLILKRLGGIEVLDALHEGGIARAKEHIADIVAESGIDVDTAGGEA